MASELRTLVELSRTLGEPSRDLVILAEGNTSIRTGPDRMLVKASGSAMGTATGEDFVEVDIQTMLNLVNDETAGADEVNRVFGEAGRGGKRPSVEAMLHALCLSVGGAGVVGHTHPVPVNMVLCSPHAERMSSDVLFPEQVVILGRTPVFVPYLDPGLTLARAVQQEMLRHIQLGGARRRWSTSATMASSPWASPLRRSCRSRHQVDHVLDGVLRDRPPGVPGADPAG